jgi:hypothetical protein
MGAAHGLQPTSELVEVLRALLSAPSMTTKPSEARFTPELTGGGRIGWTDRTASNVREAAADALKSLKT